MRLLASLALFAGLAATPVAAQVTPTNPPGSDSMSRATHPDSTSMSAPEAARRSDSATTQDARQSEIKNRNADAPVKTNQRPDQQPK